MKAFGLVCLLLWPAIAGAASSYIVSVKGHTAYMCDQCLLRTPLPDKQTLHVIDAWQHGMPPFHAPKPNLSFSVNDTVSVCGCTGCATYTWLRPGLWALGTFAKHASHVAHQESASLKDK